LDPRDGALTVDIGCGGGSQVIAIKRRRPGARGIGERTEFNAVGALPGLMRASGLSAVTERDRIATPTGPISLYVTRAG
jgi:tRNA G46 methylase TrmB